METITTYYCQKRGAVISRSLTPSQISIKFPLSNSHGQVLFQDNYVMNLFDINIPFGLPNKIFQTNKHISSLMLEFAKVVAKVHYKLPYATMI